MPVSILIALGAVAAGPAGPAARAAAERELPALLAQLGSPRFDEREQAGRRLRAVGPVALPAVERAAAGSADPEVRQRAGAIAAAFRRELHGLRRVLAGNGQPIYTARFTPDGRSVVGGGAGKAVLVWDAATGRRLHEWPVGGSVSGLTLTADGATAFLACQNGRGVARLDLATGRVTAEYAPGEEGITWYDVALSPDGKRLLAAGVNRLGLWDVATGKEVYRFADAAGVGHSQAAAFAPDGAQLVTTEQDQGTIVLRDAATGEPGRTVKSGWVGRVAFRADGKRFVAGNSAGLLTVWEAAAGKEIWTVAAHQGWACSPCFSPDGKRVASGGHDARVRLWDAETGTPLYDYRGHTDMVIGVDFSPDGRTLLSTGADGVVRLWAVPP